MKKEKNIHEGHRKRLRENIEKIGIVNVQPLNALELLLTFSIPRADTNPTSHNLLNEFQSFTSVFEAPMQAIESVFGAGPKTAELIKCVFGIIQIYNREKAIKQPKVANVFDLGFYLKNVIPYSKNEQLAILILNKNLEVKTYKVFGGYSDSEILFDTSELGTYLLKNEAKYCVIAHTHPSGIATPSEIDNFVLYERILPFVKSLSISIVDSCIITDDSFYSYKYLKEFSYSAPTTEKTPYKLDLFNFDRLRKG